MKRQIWLAGLLLAGLLVSGCAGKKAVSTDADNALEEEWAAPAAQETEEPIRSVRPTMSDVILMDGELVSAYPALELAFPGNASGNLLTLHTRLGQRVSKGDLLAVLEDAALRKEVAKAQLALDRALEDLEQGEADIEKTYRRESEDAQTKYDRAVHDAERKYARELDDARRALERARRDLERLNMQPPTTALSEAEVELARAIDRETEAADAYKQALDRPWEKQDLRDSLYKDWQASIVDRDLAELRLDDAQIALQVHQLDLEAKQKEVEDAESDLARVEKDPVDKDIVEREVNLALRRAVEDAQHELAEAQQDLEDARLYAPWDGLVLSMEVGVGANVGSGRTVITMLNIEELYFVTQNLSERHIAQLHRGQRAEITLRAYPDVVLAGTVDVILPQAERTTDTDARFVAYIRPDETELDLLPEMTGRVEVLTGN